MTKEDSIVRLNVDCKFSVAQQFRILKEELSTPKKQKSYGDVLEDLLTFYRNHSSARPNFNI